MSSPGIPVNAAQAPRRRRLVLLEALLVDIDEAVARPPVVLGGLGRVLAPLAQARHLLRQVQLLAALGLDDPDRAVGGAHDEVRRVGGQIAVGLDVVDLEADGQVVLGKGLHVRRGFQERGKGQLQAVGAGLADDAVEHRFLRVQEAARLGAERARVAQPDMPFDARAAALRRWSAH